jgi:protein-disulfide isomerase
MLMKKYQGWLVLCLTVIFAVQPVFAQTKKDFSALKKDVELLKQGQTDISKDLQEIKKLIQGMPKTAAAPVPPAPFKEAIIDIKGAPIKGDNNAKLIVVEFTDYECPACVNYARTTQPQILKDYLDTGKIKLVFMDYPLPYHKKAFKAAEAGQCDKLFEDKEQTRLEPERILKIAEGLGLDTAAFKTCLDSGKHVDDVKKRMAEGSKAQFSGTPSFYLGYMTPDGMLKLTKKVFGSPLKAAIDEMLAPKK